MLLFHFSSHQEKLRLCNNSCSYHKTCTNVDSFEKVLIVELGLNKPETMLEE